MNAGPRNDARNEPSFCRVGFAAIAKSVRAVALPLLLSLGGCAIPVTGESGSVHYVVIGLGVVSVPSPKTERVTTAITYNTLGVMASDQPGMRVALGYASGATILIPKETNVIVSLSQTPGGSLKVEESSYPVCDRVTEEVCR
jgi:hypothetical protein